MRQSPVEVGRLERVLGHRPPGWEDDKVCHGCPCTEKRPRLLTLHRQPP